MRQFALAVALLLATALFPTHIQAETHSASSAALAPQVQPVKQAEDNRVVALKNVFKRYNSPLAPYAKDYVSMADKYDVDWKLLPAISGLESSFGRFLMPNSHNGYGWGGGHIYFKDWPEGIEVINKTLRKNYMEKWNAQTVWEIGPIYAESPTWAVRVDKFMNEINSEYIALTSGAVLKPNL